MNTSVYTDFNGLAALRHEASQNGEQALEKTARQFEALFLQMMLKSMREAGQGEGLFDSEQSDLYRDMYDKQLSLQLTEQGEGLGLAKMLVQQLRATLPEVQAADAAKGDSDSALRLPVATQPAFRLRERVAAEPPGQAPKIAPQMPLDGPDTAVEQKAGTAGFDSPRQFLATLAPHAQRAAQRLGVDPRALLAQAALETGWGRAVLRHADGRSSHNLFNIKADGRWEGERVSKMSLEYRQGVANRELSHFRSYNSLAQSFDDYADFISRSPRYAEALRQADDAGRYLEELHAAGYATDPRYAEKIKGILNSDVMAQTDFGLKLSGSQTLTG